MKPDLTGSPPPWAFHLSIHSSWLHTLWTGHGEAHNIKISSSNVHIFGLWMETAAPLLPSNHDFNSHEICIWLLWAQQTSDESGHADSEDSTISYSSTCLCYSVNIFPENSNTNALPGLLLLKPKVFPESTLDPPSSTRSRSGLWAGPFIIVCESLNPFCHRKSLQLQDCFILMADSTKALTSE